MSTPRKKRPAPESALPDTHTKNAMNSPMPPSVALNGQVLLLFGLGTHEVPPFRLGVAPALLLLHF